MKDQQTLKYTTESLIYTKTIIKKDLTLFS